MVTLSVKTNHRKNTTYLRPRRTDYDGALSPYGHASVYGAGLHVYNTAEPDRPAAVNVWTVEAAREYIRLLEHFIEEHTHFHG